MEPKPASGASHVALGYATPKTYEELRAVLSSGATQMPKKLRQAAIFMWQHPGEVALGSTASIAQQVGVQPSTLVRFAQTFGFSGFSDFQEIFKAHVKATWPRNGRRTTSAISADRNTDTSLKFVSGLIGAAQESLARVEDNLSQKAFDKIVSILASANMIYLVGSKRAFPVTNYMSLTLFQQGIKNVLVDNIGSVAFDQMTCLSKDDALLAISFSPYNSITPELAAAARDRRANVVSITDSKFSPLVELSTAYLEVVESTHAGFRSLAATNVVGMGLVLAVSQAREVARDKEAHASKSQRRRSGSTRTRS